MNTWPSVDVIRGDMREVLKGYPAATFASGVTDPPYGIGFMSAGWDHGVPDVSHWSALLRVLKPGAHLAAFTSPRMSHRMTCAIEDAGFEIRDSLLWLFGSGFPKGLDVAKAIDKQRHDRDDVLEVCAWVRARRDAIGVDNAAIDAAFGFNGMAGHWTSVGTQPAVPTLEQVPALLAVLQTSEPELPERIRALLVELNGRKGEFGADWHAREVTGELEEWTERQNYAMTARDGLRRYVAHSAEAQQWEGWNTALKPAYENIILARAPIPNGWTVAECMLEHGTGAINVGACRIGDGGQLSWSTPRNMGYGGGVDTRGVSTLSDVGRWPANLCLDPEAAAMLDAHAGETRGGSPVGIHPSKSTNGVYGDYVRRAASAGYDDAGGVSRFFYCAKASREERDAGLEGWKKRPLNWSSGDANPGSFQSPGTDRSARNFHPTVKPLDLMRWVTRLITPPGGIVVDPFVGSGSTLCAATLEGFGATGIDLDTDEKTGAPIGYVDIARARSTYWRGEAIRLAEGGARPPADVVTAQTDLF